LVVFSYPRINAIPVQMACETTAADFDRLALLITVPTLFADLTLPVT
jgi:hypothetical protein